MGKRKILETEIEATPEQVAEMVDTLARARFAESGVVAVVVPLANGNGKSIQLVKVDPTAASYDEWVRRLGSKWN